MIRQREKSASDAYPHARRGDATGATAFVVSLGFSASPIPLGMAHAERARVTGVDAYRPRAAEHPVLHGLVREHLATFLRAAQRDGEYGLPAFVEQEFRDFLSCGVWAPGFARIQCADCHAERLVPFSCKGRGFCPS